MPKYTVIRNYTTAEEVTVEADTPEDAYQVSLTKFELNDSDVDFSSCWEGTYVYEGEGDQEPVYEMH